MGGGGQGELRATLLEGVSDKGGMVDVVGYGGGSGSGRWTGEYCVTCLFPHLAGYNDTPLMEIVCVCIRPSIGNSDID